MSLATLFAELEEAATQGETIEEQERKKYVELVKQYRDNQVAVAELNAVQEDLAEACKAFHKKHRLSKYIHEDLGVQALFFIRPQKSLNIERVAEALPEEMTLLDVVQIPNMKDLWPKLTTETRKAIIELITNEIKGIEKRLEVDARLLEQVAGFTKEEIDALHDIVAEREVFQVREVK